MNNDPRVFYFKYIDGAQKVMLGPQVFELDRGEFPDSQTYLSREGALGTGASHLDFRERLEPRGSRQPAAKSSTILPDRPRHLKK